MLSVASPAVLIQRWGVDDAVALVAAVGAVPVAALYAAGQPPGGEGSTGEHVSVGAAHRSGFSGATISLPYERPRLGGASAGADVMLPHPLIVACPTDNYFLPTIQTMIQMGAHMPHVSSVMSAWNPWFGPARYPPTRAEALTTTFCIICGGA